ncbi:hypothetical protein EDC64_101439 [Aquabacter spiritensis]|uniref:Uncharacterized protein n=1 Tax=Aquabacter spiritensis TaxID=933073 RepID=A0A4R3M3X5_9HYPH|nr:hypothetical protein EDC64_101439 [Aquabacter spiritensis]
MRGRRLRTPGRVCDRMRLRHLPPLRRRRARARLAPPRRRPPRRALRPRRARRCRPPRRALQRLFARPTRHPHLPHRRQRLNSRWFPCHLQCGWPGRPRCLRRSRRCRSPVHPRFPSPARRFRPPPPKSAPLCRMLRLRRPHLLFRSRLRRLRSRSSRASKRRLLPCRLRRRQCHRSRPQPFSPHLRRSRRLPHLRPRLLPRRRPVLRRSKLPDRQLPNLPAGAPRSGRRRWCVRCAACRTRWRPARRMH